MNISNKSIFLIAADVFLIVVAVFILFKFYFSVDYEQLIADKDRSYSIEIATDKLKIPTVDNAKKSNLMVSILVEDLGLNFETLQWVMNNLKKEIIVGVSPYMNPETRDFILTLKNDLYVNIPIESNNPVENKGVLALISGDYEGNVKKINSVLSIVNNIKGIYLTESSENIVGDEKTMKYLIDVAYSNRLSIVTSKTDVFKELTQLGLGLNSVHVPNLIFTGDEGVEDVHKKFQELEGNKEDATHVLMITPPSYVILNEIKHWTEREGGFLLTEVLSNKANNSAKS